MGKILAREQFEASLDSLSLIREFISKYGKDSGLSKQQIYKLCLAVDEIISNIIMYGYLEKSEKKSSISVSFSKDDSQITITTEDEAIPFNPLARTLPKQEELELPMEERKIGGLGIMLATQSVDEFSYYYKDGKNYNIFKVILTNQN